MGPCLSDFFETEYHPQLAPRCSVTPKRNLRFKAAFRHPPTTSFSGPMFTEFQQSMLSWCWAMTQKYFAPAFSYMLRNGVPPPTRPEVLCDAEAQSPLQGGFPPPSDPVLLRSHVHRVPAIDVVVVLGDDAEVLCPGTTTT